MNIATLPNELLDIIFSNLDAYSIQSVKKVSRRFHKLVSARRDNYSRNVVDKVILVDNAYTLVHDIQSTSFAVFDSQRRLNFNFNRLAESDGILPNMDDLMPLSLDVKLQMFWEFDNVRLPKHWLHVTDLSIQLEHCTSSIYKFIEQFRNLRKLTVRSRMCFAKSKCLTLGQIADVVPHLAEIEYNNYCTKVTAVDLERVAVKTSRMDVLTIKSTLEFTGPEFVEFLKKSKVGEASCTGCYQINGIKCIKEFNEVMSFLHANYEVGDFSRNILCFSKNDIFYLLDDYSKYLEAFFL